ncbi:MAG: permease, partial [Rectinema sp.]
MSTKGWTSNKKLLVLFGVFLAAYFIPFHSPRVSGAVNEAFLMLSEYARQHVVLCLVPAMFIAGAITVFLNQQSVMHYLGPDAKRLTAYGVASVSGAILAVCSCTVLPIFKGIYKKGAGLGPAIAFLYSGPAINILAIVLSAKVFGLKLGLARAVTAIVFSIVIGWLMALIYRKDDEKRAADVRLFSAPSDGEPRTLGQTAIYMASMIGILVFANWANSRGGSPVWDAIYSAKWWITGGFGLILAYAVIRWFNADERIAWVVATRDFALQILPLLFGGVLVAGFLLGRPGHEALIPNAWIAGLVGGNSLFANAFAAIAGALMYFATLTEIPIVQGLLGAGMG